MPGIANARLALGVGFGMAAGLMWGIIFSVPLLLPDYPPLALSAGRYLAFGLIVLLPAWFDRRRLAALTRRDWGKAIELSLVGNLLYFGCIAFAAQNAGAPMTAMVIGTLPVVLSIAGNLTDPQQSWRRLVPPLLIIGAGLALVHGEEGAAAEVATGGNYALGLLAALGGLLCWTWYPLRNAAWIQQRPQLSMTSWATAQGLATLPLAALAFAALAALPGYPYPLGSDPGRFLALMAALGLGASWLGTLFWNKTSQLLPTALSGQMIVFETVFGLAFAFALRGAWPSATTLAGIALLIGGVLLGVHAARHGAAADRTTKEGVTP
ncbi:MAG TPA: DMT family transporter [Rhodocyclaceae bacterium]|nr:DMT family transporter [Rhodocyclaceae bacterium]